VLSLWPQYVPLCMLRNSHRRRRRENQPDKVEIACQPVVLQEDIDRNLGNMHLAEADSLALQVVPPWLLSMIEVRTLSMIEVRTLSMNEVRTLSMNEVRTLSMNEVRTLSMNEVRTLSMSEMRTLCRVVEVRKLLKVVEVRKLLKVVEVRKLLRVVDTTPHSPLRQRRCYMTGQNLLDRS